MKEKGDEGHVSQLDDRQEAHRSVRADVDPRGPGRCHRDTRCGPCPQGGRRHHVVGARGGPLRADSGGHAQADRRREGLPALGRSEVARAAPDPRPARCRQARCRNRQGAPVRRRQARGSARAGQGQEPGLRVDLRGGRGAVRVEADDRGGESLDERIGSPCRPDGQRTRSADSGERRAARSVVADAGADRHRLQLRAARDLLRAPFEPQHQPAAAVTG